MVVATKKTATKAPAAKGALLKIGGCNILHTANGETIMNRPCAAAILMKFATDMPLKINSWVPGKHRIVFELEVPAKAPAKRV